MVAVARGRPVAVLLRCVVTCWHRDKRQARSDGDHSMGVEHKPSA